MQSEDENSLFLVDTREIGKKENQQKLFINLKRHVRNKSQPNINTNDIKEIEVIVITDRKSLRDVSKGSETINSKPQISKIHEKIATHKYRQKDN